DRPDRIGLSSDQTGRLTRPNGRIAAGPVGISHRTLFFGIELRRLAYHLIVFAFPTGQMPRISYDHRIGNNRTRRGESMNKVTRTLVMTGMAIAASAAIGVGQASAASAAPSSPSASPAASQAAKIKVKTKVIDYYR